MNFTIQRCNCRAAYTGQCRACSYYHVSPSYHWVVRRSWCQCSCYIESHVPREDIASDATYEEFFGAKPEESQPRLAIIAVVQPGSALLFAIQIMVSFVCDF